MPGLDVWHGGLSVVGFCVTILNTGKQKANNNAIGGWILNTGKQKTHNNAIGGRILNTRKQKTNNNAIGGQILNIGPANKLQTWKDMSLS
jgi:hypothetical protein